MAIHAPIMGASCGATIIPFPTGRARHDEAPNFDPANPAHRAAWAAIWSLGRAEQRRRVGDAIEAQIAVLDAIDGDSDAEDGDEDRCAGHDDHVGMPAAHHFGPGDGSAGDPDDAESDDGA